MSGVRLGLVGCGYWGPKIGRAAASLPDVSITAIVDLDRARAEAVAHRFPAAKVYTGLAEALDDVDAVLLATPPVSHVDVAEQALEAGKHVLVEKPLALSAADCDRLGRTASDLGLVLMAGHTFLFSPPVGFVKSMIDAEELGRIYTIDSQRLNLGRVRYDVDAVWNFAPHDISIVTYWLGEAPASVSCSRYTYLQDGIADVGYLTLEWSSGTVAHIHVSWLSPRKVRSMTVAGSRKMVVYDDTAGDEKIVIHDAGIDREHIGRSFPQFETYGEFQLIHRLGDLHVPRLPGIEPLVAECRHFVDCIVEGREPLTGAQHAREVVAVLEAASLSATQGGARVDLAHV